MVLAGLNSHALDLGPSPHRRLVSDGRAEQPPVRPCGPRLGQGALPACGRGDKPLRTLAVSLWKPAVPDALHLRAHFFQGCQEGPVVPSGGNRGWEGDFLQTQDQTLDPSLLALTSCASGQRRFVTALTGLFNSSLESDTDMPHP